MAGLATACAEVPDLVRVEVLENKFFSRNIMRVGSVRLMHFEADERAPKFLFEEHTVEVVAVVV